MSLPNLRIASRDSALALWQTNAVMARLQSLGFPVTIVPLKTLGDIDLVSPIYAMGVTGVFTKELDSALLNGHAALAVHSLKDVPTILPKGLCIAAVLERASVCDVLIFKNGFEPSTENKAVIATSSIRRRSQWLARYPAHTMVNVRGNVATRLKKFDDEGWDGIIFAQAGLERLGLLPANCVVLDWMIPAPAQGAIALVCREDDSTVLSACAKINHKPSQERVSMEREFLFHLEGGCSVPISACATFEGDDIHFKGAIHSIDGQRELTVELRGSKEEWASMAKRASVQIKSTAKGVAILEEFRKLNRNEKINDEYTDH